MVYLVDHFPRCPVPVLPAPSDWTHSLPHARFRSLATPSRGSTDTSVWRVSLEPGHRGTPHSLTREEVFVVLEGEVAFSTDAGVERARVGDAIVAPAGIPFAIAAEGGARAELICCLPVGGEARFTEGEPFVPPWAR